MGDGTDRQGLVVERYGGAALVLAAFGVYLSTLAPGVTFWDSGELILGSLSLGIPHPPGASAYCILGKAFSFVPVGSGAFRMNAMSAGLGALCVWLVYRLAVSLSDNSPYGQALGLAAGAGFSLCGPGWSVSVVSEVYTLVCAFLLTIAYCVSQQARGGGARWLYAAAFVYGLFMATHQSALFLVPALLVYALHGARMHRSLATSVIAVTFFALGFSVLMYLPVRSVAMPILNIGEPDTAGRMDWMLRLSDNMESLSRLLGNADVIVSKLGAVWLLSGLAVFGSLVYVFRRNSGMMFTLVGAAVMVLGVSAIATGAGGLMKWGQTSKFYVLGLSLGLPFAAAALSKAAERISPARSGLGVALASVPAIALFCSLLYAGLGENDRSMDSYAGTFARDTLNSVERRSVLVGWGDNGTFPVWYLQGWERYRDDTLFIHNELMSYGWYAEEVRRQLKLRFGADYAPAYPLTDLKKNVLALRPALKGRAKVYLDFSAVYQLELSWEMFRPQGLVYLDRRDRPRPQDVVWDGIYMPYLVESGADRRFATEGVLDIYSYQCFLWGAEACKAGRAGEAAEAFGRAEVLAPGEFTSDCGTDGSLKRTGRRFNK